jgi:predicted nucleic acid-binding protein
MTVVISDTSPINYLVLIGEIDLLPALYGKVLIPEAVLAELLEVGSPPTVVAWATILPDWVEVVTTAIETSESYLDAGLDAGELAAIILAGSLRGDILLIMDDADGRAEAVRRGFRLTGTLGVLRAAALRHLADIDSAVDRLSRTNFYLPPKLVAFLLAEDRERKGQ